MPLGDAQAWANRFVAVDERLLERITVVWPICVSRLSAQAEEDDITINLVDLLGKDAVARRLCHWIEYQFEPFGMHPNGAKFSKGKIDIAVLLDQERERYIAYECKRLNVTHRGQRSSFATPYVAEGMMRFLTEQYAEGLPVGCMLGYVMDGDVLFAFRRIDSAINANKPLALTAPPTLEHSNDALCRFRTGHQRAAGTFIELRHTLLSFANARSD